MLMNVVLYVAVAVKRTCLNCSGTTGKLGMAISGVTLLAFTTHVVGRTVARGWETQHGNFWRDTS